MSTLLPTTSDRAVVELLLARGGRGSPRNESGQTAAALATQAHHDDVAALFE